MCEIEYEEIDNKELIYRELRTMIFNNENEYNNEHNTENVKADEVKLLEKSLNETEVNYDNERKKSEIDEMYYNHENKDMGKINENNNDNKCIFNENIQLKEETETKDNDFVRQEDNTPKSISELYSQFNISWKERLKSKLKMEENDLTLEENNQEFESSDIDTSEDESNNNSPERILCDESSFYYDSENNEISLNNSRKENNDSNFNHENKFDKYTRNPILTESVSSSSDKIIALLTRSSKNVPVSSFGCGNDSEISSFSNESLKPKLVESSCFSASDEIVTQLTQKPKSNTTSSFDFENESSSSVPCVPKKSQNNLVSSFCGGNDSEISSISNISQKKMITHSGCFSASDEVINPPTSKPKSNTTSNFSCGDESSSNVPCPSKKFQNNLVSSFCGGNDSEISSISNISQKKMMTHSGCFSASDEVINPSTTKPKSNTTSNFSCGVDLEDDKKMITSSTETDGNIKSQNVFSTQIDETYNNLEEKILPFVKNVHTIELRLKGRLSVFQRACVKQIATQHKLIMKYFGKGKEGYILLRKKIELVNSQKLFLEMKRNALEKKKDKIAQDKAKRERLLNPPLKVSSGCQVDFPDKEELPETSKKAARRNRKKQWELKQKQLAKRDSETQTVAKGFYLCPYCEDDIPESHQALHYPYCLSKYRSQMQFAAKSGNGTKEKKTKSKICQRPMSSERKQRSKSREKIHNSTIGMAKKELDKIHSNDINSMVNVLNELNKRCAISGCDKKKQKVCNDCMVGYCIGHYSPENNAVDKHFNCPVALERAEIERQRKLGPNNPLFKTVEELSMPRFADGALLKKIKRNVRVMEPRPLEESAANNDSAAVIPVSGNILPPNLNETRTRNGPMLSFERNELHKRLREKIGNLSDRRTK